MDNKSETKKIEFSLPKILKEKGVTARMLFYDLKISPDTAYKLIAGNQQSISFSLLEKLCNYLEVTPGDIIKIV